MKKYILLILSLPLISLSANYDGYYPGERIYEFSNGNLEQLGDDVE